MEVALGLKQTFLTSLEDALIEELKCPFCYELMFKPIYHCERGHSLCSNCYEEGKLCRSCGSLTNGNRSYHLERISELLTYPCKNFGEGCQKRVNCEKLKQHEKECQTSKFKCPLRHGTECPFVGNKKQILFHCQLIHGEFTFVSKKYFEQRMLHQSVLNKYHQANKVLASNTTFQSFYLYYTGDILFQGVVHLNSTNITVRMFRISSSSEMDDRYDFVIKLYDFDDNLLTTYQEQCSVTDGWEDLTLNERGCIHIRLKMLRYCKYFTVEFLEYSNDLGDLCF